MVTAAVSWILIAYVLVVLVDTALLVTGNVDIERTLGTVFCATAVYLLVLIVSAQPD